MYQWKRGENFNKQNASSVSTPGKIEFKINAQNGDVSRENEARLKRHSVSKAAQ